MGMLLLAGGVALLASMFTAGTLALKKATNGQIAADRAARLIEEMRRVGMQSLNYTVFPATFDVYDPGDPSKRIGTGNLTITPVYEGQVVPMYFQVTVKVTITGTRGTGAEAEVVSFIAPR